MGNKNKILYYYYSRKDPYMILPHADGYPVA